MSGRDRATGRCLAQRSLFHAPPPSALTGIDHFFVRTAPARTFDQLGSEFNSVLFVAVVAIAAAGALVMRYLVQKRDVARAWK